MRTRLVALLPVTTLFGCAAVWGIPSDVERASPVTTNDGGPEADSGADTSQPIVDAQGEDSAVDGPPPPPPCDVGKPFDAPQPITSLNTPEDEGAARLSDDELTIYVDAIRAVDSPTYGIYFATRKTLTDSFGPLQPFPSIDDSINTNQDEYAPNVTDDGLSLIFERQNRSTRNSDIYTATRASPNDPFGPVTSVANLNTPDYEANPYLRVDKKELWHVRKPSVVTDVDIALATLTPGAGYVVSAVANVNTNGYDGSPVISRDGLTLYLSSNRPNAGNAGTNIWVTKRPTRTSEFAVPTPVTSVNSDSNEYPGFISTDGCRLYLVSSRPGGMGAQDIYVATRPK